MSLVFQFAIGRPLRSVHDGILSLRPLSSFLLYIRILVCLLRDKRGDLHKRGTSARCVGERDSPNGRIRHIPDPVVARGRSGRSAGVSVCGFGTVGAGTFPIWHTVAPSVCRFGKVPGGRRPPSSPHAGQDTSNAPQTHTTCRNLTKGRSAKEVTAQPIAFVHDTRARATLCPGISSETT